MWSSRRKKSSSPINFYPKLLKFNSSLDSKHCTVHISFIEPDINRFLLTYPQDDADLGHNWDDLHDQTDWKEAHLSRCQNVYTNCTAKIVDYKAFKEILQTYKSTYMDRICTIRFLESSLDDFLWKNLKQNELNKPENDRLSFFLEESPPEKSGEA